MPKNTSERIIDAGGAAYVPGAVGITVGGAARRGLHTLATVDGLGAEHSVFGLTAGQVLRATGAATAAFAAIADTDLPSTIVRTSRSLTAGAGLTGGGDLSADRSFAVGAGLGITVNADDVALTTPGSLTATSTNSSTGSHTHAIDSTIARSAITVTAGAGLTGGGDLSANRTLDVGAGTMITVNANDVAITAGANYQFVGTGAGTAAGWRNVSELAGAGLTHASGVLAVGAGLGITVNADDVALTTPGSLTATSTNSSTGSHTHAIDATIARSAITLTAGAGLTGGGDLTANRTFAVGAGLGITVNADDVALTTPGSLTATSTNSSTGSHTHAIDATIARAAITLTAGAGLTGGGDLNANRSFAVGAGLGITVNADDVALTTPGSLTVSTTNSSSGSHTHAITSSANPGAAASILASDASGYLRLVRLGLGVAPSYALDVSGDIRLTGSLYADGGIVDFGTDSLVEDATNLKVLGAKPVLLAQTIQASGWSITTAGGATFAGDMAVGSTVFTVNVAGTRVGINRTPDAQFSLDVAGAIRGDYLVGKHAIQLSNAVAICHFDGPAPNNLDFTGTTHSHLGVEASTITGGVIFRPGRFGKAVQLAVATTNLIRYGSFEVDTDANGRADGWSSDTQAGGAATLSRVTGLYGSYAQRVVYVSTSASADLYTAEVLTANTTYTVSFWYRCSGTSRYRLYNYATTANILAETTLTESAATWRRQIYTFTTAASPAGNQSVGLLFYLNSGWFEIDGVQIEALAYATPYCDGSLGTGHSWSGTAFASTGSRTAASVVFSSMVNRAAWTVAGWFRTTIAENDSAATTDRRPTFIQVGQPGGYASTAELRVYGTDTTIELATRNVAGTETIADPVADLGYAAGEWIFLALSYDGDKHRVYAGKAGSGTMSESVGASLAANYGTGAALALYFGNAPGFDLLDDLIVLDYAADAKLIRAIYESDAPVFVESSVAFYRSPSPAPIWVDEFGLWAKSASGNAILGVYAGDPLRVATSKAWGGIDLGDNDVLIGRSTNGYVHWDDSAQTLNVAGTITAQAGSITGALTLGASGGIYQGSGTFASPTTGLKIWNDSGTGRIGGYNGGTLQWYAGTDGKLYATGGQVGGWTLGSNSLTGTNIALGSTGYITVGSSNTVVKIDSTSPSELFWIGHANYSSAPFKVSPQGDLFTNGATFMEVGSTPTSTLTQDTMAQVYLKGDKLIIRFDNGGTARYKYLALNDTGVTWVHTTTAP